MPIQPIMPKTKQAVDMVKKAVQEPQPQKVINTYEFHLGFIPQKHPMGHSFDSEKVEHFINQLI